MGPDGKPIKNYNRGQKAKAKPAKKAKKKVAKKKMVKSRAPLVETKSRIQSELVSGAVGGIVQCKDYAPLNGVFTLLPLHAWTVMEQGLEEDQMIGRSVFSKYLNAKVKVRFQGGANQITDRQFPMELVCGFVQAPMNLTSNTSPTVNGCTPSDISAYVVARVAEYFNARSDELDFIPKRASTIRITYRRKIKSDQSKSNVLTPDSGITAFEGHTPDVNLYPKWKMMRKIHYEKGALFQSSPARTLYYPNYARIPFCVVYAPMFDGEDGTKPLQPQEIPEVSYNVAHYFTDS